MTAFEDPAVKKYVFMDLQSETKRHIYVAGK